MWLNRMKEAGQKDRHQKDLLTHEIGYSTALSQKTGVCVAVFLAWMITSGWLI